MRFENLNATCIDLGEGVDVPEDFTGEMELDQECYCGCKEYEPADLELIQGMKPMRIEVCVECKNARMNRSVWHKNKGLI